jgi:hypothetical protein
MDETVNFYRKWETYRRGFGNPEMGNHYFRKHIPSDSERQKEAKIVLHMLKRFKTLASLNYFDSNIKNRT